MALFSSGAVMMFVGTPGGGTFNISATETVTLPDFIPHFVGTGEVGPELKHHVALKPVYTDDFGSELPDDYLVLGESCSFTIVLTNWTRNGIDALENRINRFVIGESTPGAEHSQERGSMMVREGLTFMVWLLYSHNKKPAMVSFGMPKGRRYLACVVEDIVTVTGRRANRKVVTMTALPIRHVNEPKLRTWDTNMDQVLNMPITDTLYAPLIPNL
jgi:hypothetical protein